MKKIALALLVLAVTFPLVAVDISNADASITGDATVAWGVDLDSMATGFKNTLNAKLKLDFKLPTEMLKDGSEESAIYGSIKFDEIALTTIENNNADLNGKDLTYGMLEMDIDLEYAKIMGPGWWVSVKAQDDTIDYENATQNGIIGVAAAWDGQMDSAKNDLTASGGFEAGLDIGDVASIEVSFFSLTDWADTTADMNAYGIKAEAILKAVENLTFKAAVNTGFGADAATTLNDDLGFGGLVSYKVVVSDDIAITPEVGVDVHMLDGGGMDMAIGNGLIVTLPGSEITAAEDAIQDDAGTSVAWDDGVDSGLKVGWSYYMPNTGSAALGLQAHLGLSMVENLQVALGFEAADLLTSGSAMGLAAYASYTIGVVKPFGGIFMLLDNTNTIVEAGIEFVNVFPQTSFYVQYNSGNLTANDAGILQLKAKVAY
jgi:hypothetical protein